jgi:hypothetical protein
MEALIAQECAGIMTCRPRFKLGRIHSEELRMIKAVIHDGLIVPRDPLPQDWPEGTEVAVDK